MMHHLMSFIMKIQMSSAKKKNKQALKSSSSDWDSPSLSSEPISQSELKLCVEEEKKSEEALERSEGPEEENVIEKGAVLKENVEDVEKKEKKRNFPCK